MGDDVERLEIDMYDAPRGGVIGHMVPDSNGRYVSFSDYQQLARKLNTEQHEHARLKDDFQRMIERNDEAIGKLNELTAQRDNAGKLSEGLEADVTDLKCEVNDLRGRLRSADALFDRIYNQLMAGATPHQRLATCTDIEEWRTQDEHKILGNSDVDAQQVETRDGAAGEEPAPMANDGSKFGNPKFGCGPHES